jgi:uncharacterized protein
MLKVETGNGIAWREWGEAAFEEARAKKQPLLLDISAVWCHWCHVMDETTYAHQGVIDLVNAECVPVRVDNDLRPDINARYNMGGWPSTAFLTPSGDILAGATYLTAAQMLEAVERVVSYYRLHQLEIATAALEARRRSTGGLSRSTGTLNAKMVEGVIAACGAAYDPVYGGFGAAPKFPQTEAIIFLLEQAQVWRAQELRKMAVMSLEQMAKGGMYDQVEGGFFRYATNQDWSVPHFEKMLEDNAGLVNALARAGMTEALDRTTGYLDAVLANQGSHCYGGSQDADEEYYKLDIGGRKQRGTPLVDRRVYTNWNAALVVAYLEAYAWGDREGLRERGGKLMGELFATKYKVGEGWEHAEGTGGLLGDQVWGLLATVKAYQWGLGKQWWEIAKTMADELEAKYGDSERGGYFDTAEVGVGRLQERMKPLVENAVAAMALMEMDTLQGDAEQKYRQQARKTLESVAGVAMQAGVMGAVFARALDRLDGSVKVSTSNWELARRAVQTYPYVVIDPSGDERAVVCVGTTCLAPVTTAEEVTRALSAAWGTRKEE